MSYVLRVLLLQLLQTTAPTRTEVVALQAASPLQSLRTDPFRVQFF